MSSVRPSPLAVAFGLTLLFGPADASAQQRAAPAASCGSLLRLDLPAQSMDASLIAFSRSSGMDILYEREQVVRHQAPALNGCYSALDALERLVAPSGLNLRFVNAHSVMLVRDATAKVRSTAKNSLSGRVLQLEVLDVRSRSLPQGPRIGSQRGEFAAYAALAARRIQNALFGELRKADVRQNPVLALWLDAKGRILRVDFTQGSGNDGVDRDIKARVMQVEIGQTPPSGLPQPLQFQVELR